MAPKKRKGKMANKLAAMSDEERERYLQHRAALQEEKRRRKEQLVATFIKNKLKREEAYTRINTAKINQNWRLLLRKIKSKELQQEVECMWHTFRRHVDRREANIAELLRALDLSERQYCDMLQAHLETTERLEEVHLEHISDLRELINAQIADKVHKAMADMARIQVTQEKRKRAIQTVLSAMVDAMPARNYARYEKKVRAEELRQKLREERETYAADRANKLESLWLETKDILTNHISRTAAKRKVVKKLQSMDHDWISELENLDKRTVSDIATAFKDAKEQFGILLLFQQHYLSRINALGEKRLATLKIQTDLLSAERDGSLSCHKSLLNALDRDLKRDDEKFRRMTICSEQAIKELKATLTEGEKIMATINLMQRLESKEEQESVMNLKKKSEKRTSSNEISDQGFLEESTEFEAGTKESESLEQKEMRIYAKLDNFWLRYNKVHVEVSTARIKRDMLLLENSHLRSQLRNYASNISRAPSIYAQRPTLSSRRYSIYSTDGRMTATVSEISQCG